MDDPDEPVEVPAREFSAVIELLRATAAALDADPKFGADIADVLTIAHDGLAALPEVGAIRDAEDVRLFVHMLDARLRRCQITEAAPIPPPPVTVPATGSHRIRKASRSAAIVDDELADSFVWWDDISDADVLAYQAVLEEATEEGPLQRYLARNPRLLVQHLGGGHGRWVLPQKRLGAEYVPDFIIGERSSGGFEWQFVELQSPTARLFVESSGRQSPQFDEGLRQIAEWRRWLDNNRDYARRPRSRDGLGLEELLGLSHRTGYP